MTIVLSIALVISIVGMVSLIVLKRWELSTGHVVGGRVRPAVGATAARVLAWAEYALPGLVRVWAGRAWGYARAALHRLAALVVLLAEHLLERTLHLLRRKTQVPRGDAEASAFLREVSAHKKELLKTTRDHTIYEE